MSQVEKARIKDVPQMHQLINHFADKGEMLPRPLSDLYEDVRDFFVVREGDRMVACAALHVNWADLAEVRSVAVDEFYQQQGIGTKLIEACLKESAELGIRMVFCFTYQPDFFKRLNFAEVDKMELPRKVWTDCLRCPKFPNCDEVALIYRAEEQG